MLHTARLTPVIFIGREKKICSRGADEKPENANTGLMQQLRSTKSHPVFLRNTDSSSSFSPPPYHSLHHHQPPFSPAAVTRATGDSKSCCRATAGSMLPALEEMERERASEGARARERASSLSTKRYYCLATSHVAPPPTPTTTSHHPVSLRGGGRGAWGSVCGGAWGA